MKPLAASREVPSASREAASGKKDTSPWTPTTLAV